MVAANASPARDLEPRRSALATRSFGVRRAPLLARFRARSSTVAWLLAAALLASCGGGKEDEARARTQQCKQLRDHLVELRLASATNLGNDLAQHRAALTQALGPQFLDACATRTSKDQIACALAAKDSQAAADCQSPVADTGER
jgi:hypothetical protein